MCRRIHQRRSSPNTFRIWIADYFDHKSIATKLGTVARRERITYSQVSQELGHGELVTAFSELKKELDSPGVTADVTVEGGRVRATITYEHVDYSKVELRQVQVRDAVIEVSKEADGSYVIRSTQNQFTDTAVELLFAKLQQAKGSPIDRTRVSLQGQTDHKLRTDFFEKLVNGVEGYDFVTVTDAYCFKPKAKAISKDDDDDGELEDQPYVERVALRGEGVDKSFVADDLYKNQYYLVKTVWRIRKKGQIDSDHFELEAQFSSPDTCTDFSYQIRSVVICDEGKPTDKRRLPKLDEQEQLFRKLERAARAALEAVGG